MELAGSLVSQVMVRTPRSVVAITLVMPFLPFAPLLGLTPLPPLFLGLVAVIVAMYILSGELVKRIFYRHFEPARAGHA